MRGLLLLLVLLTPWCASAGKSWICHRADGSRVFQDRPCDQAEPPLAGVMNTPPPRADDANPGWCQAHQAWRDEARAKGESAAGAAEAARWHARQQAHERWLKSHRCS